MLLSRSPRRTNWHIQWADLFFWPLWNIWQYWSLSPCWTFCNPLFINACPNSLLILLFLYYFFSVSFTSSLFFLYPPLNVDVKKKRILMSARLQPWSFFFSSHYMLASATNMCWWLSNLLGPQISSISRPKYPTSYWTAPLGWLLSISKSKYPTHQIFNHSNQPMLPISVNDTTIHSVTEIWVWFFLLPF